jgi:hypothetical protein
MCFNIYILTNMFQIVIQLKSHKIQSVVGAEAEVELLWHDVKIPEKTRTSSVSWGEMKGYCSEMSWRQDEMMRWQDGKSDNVKKWDWRKHILFEFNWFFNRTERAQVGHASTEQNIEVNE